MPPVIVLHTHIECMVAIHCQHNKQTSVWHDIDRFGVYPCANDTRRLCRKSRIVGTVEEVHRPVDKHCVDRLGAIQAVKERHAYELKQKAGRAVRPHPHYHPYVCGVCINKYSSTCVSGGVSRSVMCLLPPPHVIHCLLYTSDAADE